MKKQVLIIAAALLMAAAANAHRADSIQAQWTHSGLFAKGDYKIHSTTDTSLELIDKPIIVVEGWDPFGIFNNDNDGIYKQFNDDKTNRLGDSLQNRGYDIIVLNFEEGAGWIQDNAFVLIELIERINANKVGEEKLIVCGISMGGLVARFALRYMEHMFGGQSHDCKLFISFDAPQKGANVPLGSQIFALKHPFLQTILGQVIKSKPASRQSV